LILSRFFFYFFIIIIIFCSKANKGRVTRAVFPILNPKGRENVRLIENASKHKLHKVSSHFTSDIDVGLSRW